MYGPTQILPIPNSLLLIGLFMFLGGITSAHTIIPTLPEIIEAGKNELNYPAEVLNDLSSGLFNMFFAFGEILGPLIGNHLYVEKGMAKTCEIIGISVITFSIIYFLVCDKSMPWNKSKKVRVLLEEDVYSSLKSINQSD
mmetsp:Transcript_34872/g.34536  ORF Transcript_34872/g.34536 Transcript_34872/m.34536 type:complete len:140 (+) Transcript_34872:986-1405(+)